MVKLKSFFKKTPIDTWAIVLLFVINLYSFLNLTHWNRENRIIKHDVVSYYGYLPAFFIYGDITLKNPNQNYREYNHNFFQLTNSDGAKVYKTTMGMAILYSPFFGIGHLICKVSSSIPNGFSSPYSFGLCLSSLFYATLGVIFFRKFLRNHFTPKIIAVTIILIGLGTNFLYYTILDVGMTHIYLFCLFSIAMCLIHKWINRPKVTTGAGIGLLFGLMILIRPTMIITLLFPILYAIGDFDELKNRLQLIFSHYIQVAIMAIAAFVVFIPQLLYWKIATGHFIYYSYSGEGFFFSDPQILNFLFSFRKGWFIYSPIMLLAIVGIGIMFFKRDKNTLVVVSLTCLYIYLSSSWWVWWFGGGFGSRTMIDMFPVLGISLATCIQSVLVLQKKIKAGILSVIAFLLLFNLFQTRQVHEGLLHHDSMTKEAYFKILFKLQNNISREEVIPYLKTPDYEGALVGKRD